MKLGRNDSHCGFRGLPEDLEAEGHPAVDGDLVKGRSIGVSHRLDVNRNFIALLFFGQKLKEKKKEKRPQR